MYMLFAESLQEHAVQEGALKTLSQYLCQDDDSDVINMALMAIGCLADSGKVSFQSTLLSTLLMYTLIQFLFCTHSL